MPDNRGQSKRFELLRNQAMEIGKQPTEYVCDDFPGILEIIEELKLYQTKLEIQNDELLRAQQELCDLHHQYENLYEFAPCGYVTINDKGLITRVNLAGAAFIGKEKGWIRHVGFSQFVDPAHADIFLKARRKAGETGERQCVELCLKKDSNASPCWVRADIEAERDDADAVIQWRMVLVDITESVEMKEKRKAALKGKEALLRELYHRTKNNMQVILSMINLQADGVEDDYVLDIFKKLTNQIISMSLVHQKLYQSEDLSRVDLKDFLEDLVKYLANSYQDRCGEVKICTDMESIRVPIESATPVGLIINELVCNATKHAFPDNRKGKISICLERKDNRQIELSISDNGVGLPPGLDIEQLDSLGLKTANLFVKMQLHGTFKVESSPDAGTCIVIRFKENTENSCR